MNFPGSNKLALSEAAILRALEDALNSTRLPGEDTIRVTEITRPYGYGQWELSITTDELADAAVTTLQAVA
jgi:hypothetical protein